MIKKFAVLFLSIILFSNVIAQNPEDSANERIESTEINDGPYIFIEKNKLIEKNIVRGKVVDKNLSPAAYDTIYKPEKAVFKNVDKIAAISDFHGQFDLGVEIMKNNKIIDEDLNWDFGEGHLVIVGDIFDRGDQVNELLWLVYKLEDQAEKQGGKVHFVMGNHEYMILNKDFRYINEKYETVAELLDLEYDELYSNKTVLGRWLRSKPMILKINDILYVHGGFAEDFLDKVDFDIEAINDRMSKAIDRSKTEMKETDFYKTYFRTPAPIWYRGYFQDTLEAQEITTILKKTEAERIIVGHTSHDKIVNLYDNRIFGVDSDIKKGKDGELLLILRGKFYRGTREGERIEL